MANPASASTVAIFICNASYTVVDFLDSVAKPSAFSNTAVMPLWATPSHSPFHPYPPSPKHFRQRGTAARGKLPIKPSLDSFPPLGRAYAS
ncbi:hypothetical protein C8034_v000521 [Colletotrichum sidae]|uniref:Uncharacterized protein n=1 Tax=Colletotrichum sidae TaxID=1347389 RepID=A0A4R8THM3_9PEZI|nr:hypothetical protein C8034_v000521 [Colletotrichum sidae]